MGTATNVAEAVALDAAGVDVIVASGIEAGGHRASFLRPVAEALAVSALVPQVVDRVRVPVVAAGGIADGRGAVAAMVLGAQGVQVGTAFLASPESGASPPHKKALVEGTERSTMLTRAYTGRYARGLVNQGMRDLLRHEPVLPSYPWQGRMMAPLTRAAAKAGNPELMALWAGQNVPLVSLRPAAELMAFLVADIDRVVKQMEKLSRY
jgi:nitronate monooxygenase